MRPPTLARFLCSLGRALHDLPQRIEQHIDKYVQHARAPFSPSPLARVGRSTPRETAAAVRLPCKALLLL